MSRLKTKNSKMTYNMYNITQNATKKTTNLSKQNPKNTLVIKGFQEGQTDLVANVALQRF